MSHPPQQQQQHTGLSRALVTDMLAKMTVYFDSMTSEEHRFYYRCLPESSKRLEGHCPVRDLGSAWDATTLLQFWSTNDASTAAATKITSRRLFQDDYDTIRPRLLATILQTLETYRCHFDRYKDKNNKGRRACARISSQVLQEPSSIAHSAFWMLAHNGVVRLRKSSSSSSSGDDDATAAAAADDNDHDEMKTTLQELVNGILSQQQQDNGALASVFGDSRNIYRGIEFYPGEALLALLDTRQVLIMMMEQEQQQEQRHAATCHDILVCADKAFGFYSDYYRRGNVAGRYTSFWANWQVQAFGKYLDALLLLEQQQQQESGSAKAEGGDTSSTTATETETASSTAVADYILELCNDVLASHPWKTLCQAGRNSRRVYAHLSTVEMACGLEALAEGTRVAIRLGRDDAVDRYWPCIVQAVDFVKAVQDQVPNNKQSVGYGGLGFGLQVSEQRLDVTGHAVNALVKVSKLENLLSD